MVGEVVRGLWKDNRHHEEITPWCPSEEWHQRRAPQHDWLVEGAFLKGTVAILAGDGGLGKSLLLQQLITASAIGAPWLGMQTQQMRSLAIFCEDDMDELHRRQERINDHYGCRMSDLEPVLMDGRPGRDSCLMQFKQWGGDGYVTPLFNQIWEVATLQSAQIVILDTLADVFTGNEVDRNQPRVFIRTLRKLALALQGVVILTQHPSVEGMNSGTGRSGSTGWHNSVRSRLYLTKERDENKPDHRLLKTMKQNHGRSGGKLPIIWKDGVFELVPDETVKYHWQD